MSGGRRVQIVDWVWILYFSIGLGQVALWLFRFLLSVEVPAWLIGNQTGFQVNNFSDQEIITPNKLSLPWKSIFIVGALIFVASAVIPLVEQKIPSRYTDSTLQYQLDRVLMMDNGEILREFLDNGGIVQQGKALYPRYYPAGEGDESQPPNDRLRKFGNLRFYLAGPDSYKIVLPLPDSYQFSLPNYGDVLVFGCGAQDLGALAIFVEPDNYILFRDPLPEKLDCPLPIPLGE
jgi:hypothetical protein